MDRLVVGDLIIVVDEREEGIVRLTWQGMSNSKDPGQALRPFFAIVASRAAEKAATIDHRFEDLSYMNSSTVAALLQLLQEGQRRGFKQRVYYDGSQRWQALNFEALRAFAAVDEQFEVITLRKDKIPQERNG